MLNSESACLVLATLYTFKLKTSHMISGHILSWSKSALPKQQICVDVHQLKSRTIFQNKSTLKWPKLQPPNNPVWQMNVNLTSRCKMLISHFNWKIEPSQKWCITPCLYSPGEGCRWREAKGSKGLGLRSVSETSRTMRLWVSAYLQLLLYPTICTAQVKVKSLSLSDSQSFTLISSCFVSVHVFRWAEWLVNW